MSVLVASRRQPLNGRSVSRLQSAPRSADLGTVEPIKRPGDRDLTREDRPGVLGGLAAVAAFIVLASTGHPIFGAAVLGIAMFLAFTKMPREQREAVGREVQRRERTPVGRILKVIEVLGGLLLLYVLAQAALRQW